MDHVSRLLLISNSTSYGSGYLDHCAQSIVSFLGEDIHRVSFIPYAKSDMDGYEELAAKRFKGLGYDLESVHRSEDPNEAIKKAEAIFIGGGNTFLLLSELYSHHLMDILRERVLGGMPYIGTSAGSNVACVSIKTTNDMPIVYPPSFDALELVPININPHYIDPDPDSKHKGETRIQRIQEFHEHNEPPVVALREGSMLLVEGKTMTLKGTTGAKLFERGKETREIGLGEKLNWLLE